MPVVFTFMFLTFASGLVVYWLINNILGIAQQYWANTRPEKAEAKG
jgi:YidC/Oxa1 family membrane protein insertase